MDTTVSDDLERVGRIIRLINMHRQGQSLLAHCLDRDHYLQYYLSPADGAFWLDLKQAPSFIS